MKSSRDIVKAMSAPEMTAGMTQQRKDETTPRIPAGRWGTAETDLAGPAVFLASAASDFINGQILYVDGGFLSYIGRSV